MFQAEDSLLEELHASARRLSDLRKGREFLQSILSGDILAGIDEEAERLTRKIADLEERLDRL